MSETKHTPGPWTADRGYPYNTYYVVPVVGPPPSSHPDLAPIEIACVKESVYRPGVSEEMVEANARLIAAAPELLEALKELARVVTGTLEGYGVLAAPLQAARAAIRRARP
jgi:hypothetical protein